MPFSSCINPSFWFELSRLKLDDFKLNDDFKNLSGFYNNCNFWGVISLFKLIFYEFKWGESIEPGITHLDF